ncbi:Hsp70 family protein [Dactylosporangium darangshiense]|uniref:Hsp70 family protein n=1 Tax=Dactylosporangium darangshiense TaxID=579108 RepID=UPI00363E5DD0
MGVVYGIDFGTSTSAIVVGRADGTFLRVKDPGSPFGRYSVPTAVCLQRDGTFAVGAAAERTKRLRPDRYRAGFKREFADPTPTMLGDRPFRSYELAAEVLRFLRAQAMQVVPEEAATLVVTVPAAWEGASHDLMHKAAALAGFGAADVRLVTEPVAAAAYAAHGTADVGATTLVYDLGGGTFDCAIARRNADGTMEVLGQPGGIDGIGGLAFDRAVLRHIRAEHPEQTGTLLDSAATDAATWRKRLQLQDTCEQIKIQLSITEAHEEMLSELDDPVVIEITRDQLEAVLAPLLDETLDECERLLAEQGLEWPDIDAIIPVGGSSRLPLVAKRLSERSGRPVRHVDDPDLAIAHGAAILAGPRPAQPAPQPEAEPEAEAEAEPEPQAEPQAEEVDGPTTARIADGVRAFLARLRPSSRFHLAPGIPGNKLTNALSMHPTAAGEEVLALYDFTVWGGAKESMLFTSLGVRYRNSGLGEDTPRFFDYTTFGSGAATVESQGTARFSDGVPRGLTMFNEGDVTPIRDLLHEINRLAQGHLAAVPEATFGEQPGGPVAAPMPAANLLAEVRRLLAAMKATTKLRLAPDIQSSKLANARSAHKVDPGEDVLALYDFTLWGGAKESALFTTRGLRLRNGWGSKAVRASTRTRSSPRRCSASTVRPGPAMIHRSRSALSIAATCSRCGPWSTRSSGWPAACRSPSGTRRRCVRRSRGTPMVCGRCSPQQRRAGAFTSGRG